MTGKENPEKRERFVLAGLTGLLVLAGLLFGYATLQPATGGVSFSKDSGFYKKPFRLTIRAEEGAALYYTLDGSKPDEKATRYTEPLYIDNATNHANTISMEEIDGLIGQQADGEERGYVVPDYPVDKCTVLRLLCVAADGSRSYHTKTYFVDRNEPVPGGYTICLLTDADNLFDRKTGIYVNEVNDGEDANYFGRGRAWERDADLVIFDETGKELVNKHIGIRIHGGMTRKWLPKGFNLYARKQYDNEPYFPCDLFGTGFYAKRLTLETGGNQPVNPVSDYLVQSRITGLQVAYKHYIPCELYLNGEYWGFYWICEKYDEEFVSHVYGCDVEDVILYKAETTEPDITAQYFETMDFIRSHDMSDEENYAKACERIDIGSYIDYNAVMLYIGRWGDWPMANFQVWRTKSAGGEGYYDGRWRWMVFDCNSACMGFADTPWDTGTLQNMLSCFDNSPESAAFSSLWVNESFRNRFRDRMTEIAQTCFRTEDVEALIDAFDAQMRPYLERSWARYYGKDNNKAEEYNESVAVKKDFFRNRSGMLHWWFYEEVYAPWFSGYTYESYRDYFSPQNR